MPTLLLSDPLLVTESGTVIENLLIRATGETPGIFVSGADNVVIRNVRIEHEKAHGLTVADSPGLRVENIEIINVATPDAGPHDGLYANIDLFRSEDAVITNARVEGGSSGLIAFQSHGLTVDGFEATDQRGPFPRGQGVQLDHTNDATIQNFLIRNDPATAWTEDNINILGSSNVVIRDGVIDGGNSPSGMGVLVETYDEVPSSDILVERVQVTRFYNGAFSAANDSTDVTFRDVYATHGLTVEEIADVSGENFRGAPLSGQEAYHAYLAGGDIRFENAAYYDLPAAPFFADNPDAVITADIAEALQELADEAFGVTLPWDPEPVPGSIVIEASADLYLGAPVMQVLHAGRLLWEGAVDAEKDIGERMRIEIETAAPLDGAGGLEIVFANDAYGGDGLDRNLIIHGVEIDGRAVRLDAFDGETAVFTDDVLVFYTEDAARLPDLEDDLLLAPLPEIEDSLPIDPIALVGAEEAVPAEADAFDLL